jgi:hypothetical protein
MVQRLLIITKYKGKLPFREDPEMIGATLGAVLIGFPFGFLAGYFWRDRISRARRAPYLADRRSRHVMRELDSAVAVLAPRDDMF